MPDHRDPNGPTAEEEAALLEQLALNAPTSDIARRYIDRLELVRAELPNVDLRPREKADPSAYRRGYQAGWQARDRS
jgi:hypothetical protein